MNLSILSKISIFSIFIFMFSLYSQDFCDGHYQETKKQLLKTKLDIILRIVYLDEKSVERIKVIHVIPKGTIFENLSKGKRRIYAGNTILELKLAAGQKYEFPTEKDLPKGNINIISLFRDTMILENENVPLIKKGQETYSSRPLKFIFSSKGSGILNILREYSVQTGDNENWGWVDVLFEDVLSEETNVYCY